MPAVQYLPLSSPDVTDTVMGRFRSVAAALPDQVAVVSPGSLRTFAQLDAESDAVAAALSAADPGQQPVAMLLDHGVSGVVGLLGALKLGRPVVPLDPLVPAARLQQIVEVAGVRCCLSDAAHASLAGSLGPGVTTIVDIGRAASGAAARQPRLAAAKLTDVTVIVFTSGSTGTPKGVVWTHGTLLNEAYAGAERLGFAPGDRVGLVLPYTFAAGLTVLFFALLNGAAVHMYDPRTSGVLELPDFIAAHRLTTLSVTPSLLRSLVGVLAPARTLTDLRLLMICGEPVYGDDIAGVRPHLSRACACVNWCGASEIGSLSFCALGAEAPLPQGPMPAGLPAAGKQVALYREDGTPAAQGETGEVVVTSAFTAAGYWNGDPSIASRFSVGADGRRTYRTGDLGRFDANGALTLLGRKDAAVKVRGYLVEPAEIEAVLRSSAAVGDAVVVPVAEPSGSKRLIAYVVPRPGEKVVSSAALRRLVRAKLPAWMVPATIVWLPELPRNERGKVDRLALSPPAARSVPFEEPFWDRELLVADLWKQVLQLEQIGMHDDFTELGGDSLAAAELLSLVTAKLGVTLHSSALIEAPTLKEFVVKVSNARHRVPSHPTVVSIRTTGSRPPLFCFAGAGGLGLNFLSLARHLGDEQPVYAFQAHGLEQRGLPDWSIERSAARHLQMIRVLAPRGPYLLAGHSLGGLIALEAAHQLKASGDEVQLLALLDPYLPLGAQSLSSKVQLRGPTGNPDARATPRTSADKQVGPWVIQNLMSELRVTLSERLHASELAKMARVALSGLVQYPGSLQFRVFFDQGCVLARLYRPRSWDGPTLFLRAQDNRDPEDAWSQLLPQQRVLRVSAVHLSMLNEPHVAEIAAALRDGIGRALSGQTQPLHASQSLDPHYGPAVAASEGTRSASPASSQAMLRA
jgi:amino acid adenylation domain-containing protein